MSVTGLAGLLVCVGFVWWVGYLVFGAVRERSHDRLPEADQALLEEMRERLAETEERLDSTEQALRRQSQRQQLPPQ